MRKTLTARVQELEAQVVELGNNQFVLLSQIQWLADLMSAMSAENQANFEISTRSFEGIHAAGQADSFEAAAAWLGNIWFAWQQHLCLGMPDN